MQKRKYTKRSPKWHNKATQPTFDPPTPIWPTLDPDANATQVGGSHYQKQAVQHWDYVLANGIPYMEAQVIKYVSRWRAKNGLQDLEKAAHFLQKLIEHERSLGTK